jgi:hypothetical protein
MSSIRGMFLPSKFSGGTIIGNLGLLGMGTMTLNTALQWMRDPYRRLFAFVPAEEEGVEQSATSTKETLKHRIGSLRILGFRRV